VKPAVRRGLAAGRRGSHIATERGQIVLEDERVPQQLLHHGQGHEHQQEGAPKGQYKEYTDRGGAPPKGRRMAEAACCWCVLALGAPVPRQPPRESVAAARRLEIGPAAAAVGAHHDHVGHPVEEVEEA